MRMGDRVVIRTRVVSMAAVLCLSAAAGVFGLRDHLNSSAAGGYMPVVPPDVALLRPATPAIESHAQVMLHIQSKLTPVVTSHPYSMEYGGFDFGRLALPTRGAGKAPALGIRDVWKVTFTGLRIGRPCGATRSRTVCPPPVSTMAVFVDDKSGTVIESEGW